MKAEIGKTRTKNGKERRMMKITITIEKREQTRRQVRKNGDMMRKKETVKEAKNKDN